MTPTVSETLYTGNNFYFNPVVYPKDEYVRYDEDYRVLSKFNLKINQNINDIYYSKVYLFILKNIINVVKLVNFDS